MKNLIRLLPLLFALCLTAARAQVTVYTNASLTNTPVLVVASTQSPTLKLYNISNPTAATVYVQFFQAATAGSVTLGTTPPYFWLAIPANNGVTDNSLVLGPVFTGGMVIAATTTPTGSTAPSSPCPITLFYQ